MLLCAGPSRQLKNWEQPLQHLLAARYVAGGVVTPAMVLTDEPVLGCRLGFRRIFIKFTVSAALRALLLRRSTNSVWLDLPRRKTRLDVSPGPFVERVGRDRGAIVWPDRLRVVIGCLRFVWSARKERRVDLCFTSMRKTSRLPSSATLRPRGCKDLILNPTCTCAC